MKTIYVVVGNKQHTYNGYEELDWLSPTVTTSSIFLTGVIEVNGSREISIMDVGNACIQANNDEGILMLP